eukprot:jgi/Chrzof1/6133/Cz17g12030.t1
MLALSNKLVHRPSVPFTAAYRAPSPFCHRVLLTLESKGIPYSKEYIDFADKPQWLLEKAGGKVPVIKLDESSDDYLADSDEIVKVLEQRYPSPSMSSQVPADV